MKKRIIILILLLGLIEGVFLFLMDDLNEITGQPMLDMTYYDGERFYDIVDSYGQEGLAIYEKMQVLDSVFPLVYGLLFFTILRSYNSPYAYVPFLGMTFDYLENISNFFLIRWPVSGLPTLTFAFTAMKFLFITVSLGLIVYSWRLKIMNQKH